MEGQEKVKRGGAGKGGVLRAQGHQASQSRAGWSVPSWVFGEWGGRLLRPRVGARQYECIEAPWGLAGQVGPCT